MASKPFTFLIGEHKKKCNVHAALIAYHSRLLGAWVNKHLLEAKVSCFLEDVDEDTFTRFAQYVYTGDYPSANPEMVFEKTQPDTSYHKHVSQKGSPGLQKVMSGHPEETPVSVSEQNNTVDVSSVHHLDSFDSDDLFRDFNTNEMEIDGMAECSSLNEATTAAKSKTIDLKSKKEQLWEQFTGQKYIISSPRPTLRKQEPYDNYTEVFLCHARIYVFAEKYSIWPLKALSLHKLQQILIDYIIYEERIVDIVNLLRYSYSRPASQGSVNSLSLLVAQYAACVVEELAKSPLFYLALEEFGSFGKDIMKQMLKRVG